ncbi:acyltransferase 3 [Paenibacillus curdlanolyticus YK9]|uniref:Acyltransferase 3 n=1 Tax=Paenibacillus curdlanolyticus YK9 TaxID=717606 RepID=E0IDC1_9BACL|nr:acyltransferase [Paenibacillus curdlanolyticus]EFM09576.1 acyltransferase 3 [Paenibacillus curdlanolyticus YK9]
MLLKEGKLYLSNRKPVVHEMNILRGIAMLGVLTVHSTSSAVVKLKESSLFGLFNALNTVALFCVPAFVFLTGFVLFYNYSDKKIGFGELGTFFKKRLMYILVPYAFISLLYLGIKQLYVIRAGGTIEPLNVLSKYFDYLITGNAYTHLYYVIITVQLYVVFPLLLFLVNRLRNRGIWLVAVGIALQVGFYYANRYWLHVPSKGSVALSYAGPFMLGMYAAVRYEVLVQWMTRKMPIIRILMWLAWASSAVFLVYVWHELRTGGHKFSSQYYEFGYEAFTLLTIPILLQVCSWIRSMKSRVIETSMTDLGGLSFGIYLIHPVFLLAYRELVPLPGMPYQYVFWVAGIFAVALIGSIVVLLPFYRWAGWSWMLFGVAPSKFRKPATASNQGNAGIGGKAVGS